MQALLDVAGMGLSRHDRTVLSDIAGEWREKAAGQEQQALQAMAKSFLEQPRRRRRQRPYAAALEVPMQHGGGGRVFTEVLAADASKERLRDIRRSGRIWNGLRGWHTEHWVDAPCVLKYERAAGRVEDERGGHAEPLFMRGVVN